jgi:hypothetical protein
MYVSAVIALADAIPDMRALSKLDVHDNEIPSEGQRALQQAAGSRYTYIFSCLVQIRNQIASLTLLAHCITSTGLSFCSCTADGSDS